VAPSVRPGLRFRAGVSPNGSECPAALALQVLYVGETAEVPSPQGIEARVIKARREGDSALVTADVEFLGTSEPTRRVQVLATREAGSWWVVTPGSFNILNARKTQGPAALEEQRRSMTQAARQAREDLRAGEAARTTAGRARPCPSAGSSGQRDPRGDINRSQVVERSSDQPAARDLIDARHALDGDTACFALRFADDVPAEGSVELRVLPGGRQVDVRWAADGAVGERASTSGDPVAVRVELGRTAESLVVRVPAAQLGLVRPPYRWAVVAAFPIADRDAHFDSVPSDLAISGNGGDQYVRHAG
jgi:hypothetical protein